MCHRLSTFRSLRLPLFLLTATVLYLLQFHASPVSAAADTCSTAGGKGSGYACYDMNNYSQAQITQADCWENLCENEGTNVFCCNSAKYSALGLGQAGGGTQSSSSTPSTTLKNPIGVKNLNEAIGKIIKAALGLSGAVALLMFVWGGVQWLISGGSAERVKAGKNTLTWATIGLVVIFTAYVLVNLVVKTLEGKPS